jgi:hypothetical protein
MLVSVNFQFNTIFQSLFDYIRLGVVKAYCHHDVGWDIQNQLLRLELRRARHCSHGITDFLLAECGALSSFLKGLSHEVLGPVYWPVWMHLGLNENRFWFFNFEEAPLI